MRSDYAHVWTRVLGNDRGDIATQVSEGHLDSWGNYRRWRDFAWRPAWDFMPFRTPEVALPYVARASGVSSGEEQ